MMILLQVYFGAGVLFAIVFVTFLVTRLTEGGKASWPFRFLIVPSVIAMWPFLLFKVLAHRHEEHI